MMSAAPIGLPWPVGDQSPGLHGNISVSPAQAQVENKKKKLSQVKKELCFSCKGIGHKRMDCPVQFTRKRAKRNCLKNPDTENRVERNKPISTENGCAVQEKKNKKRLKREICFWCKATGHKRMDCPVQSTQKRAKRKKPISTENVCKVKEKKKKRSKVKKQLCHWCKSMGHKMKDCTIQYTEKRVKRNKLKERAQAKKEAVKVVKLGPGLPPPTPPPLPSAARPLPPAAPPLPPAAPPLPPAARPLPPASSKVGKSTEKKKAAREEMGAVFDIIKAGKFKLKPVKTEGSKRKVGGNPLMMALEEKLKQRRLAVQDSDSENGKSFDEDD